MPGRKKKAVAEGTEALEATQMALSLEMKNEGASEEPPSPKKKPGRTPGKAATDSKKKGAKKKDDKQEEAVQSKRDKARAVVTKLKSSYKGKVFLGHEYTMPWALKRLPTGILELDIAVQGGFPAGGFTMIYGPEGIGKNYIANRVLHHQQLFLGDQCAIAVVSTEMPYDKSFAKVCDVQVGFSEEEIEAQDRAYSEASGEHLTDEEKDRLRFEIGTFVTIPPTTAEEAFDIAIELIASRVYDVVIIDSFGSLLTADDEEKNMSEQARVGGPSAVNTRFARKMNAAFAPDANGKPNMTCVIGINQIRDEMDRANKFSPKTHETGGWMLKHARFVGIELKPFGKVKQKSGKKDESGKDKEITIGKTVQWAVTKQKAGGHEGAVGDYDYIWSLGGIDRVVETMKAALKYGVMKRSGSWFSYDGDNIGQGVSEAADYIREMGLLKELEERTLSAAEVYCNYVYNG
jgi:recombination protein RecA